jgi:flavodoxin
MKKILVVYYSRTGITKKLARSIVDILSADGEEIVDTKNRA